MSIFGLLDALLGSPLDNSRSHIDCVFDVCAPPTLIALSRCSRSLRLGLKLPLQRAELESEAVLCAHFGLDRGQLSAGNTLAWISGLPAAQCRHLGTCLRAGGPLEGVAHLVDQFHAHGVKVLLPYHPWDLSTRRELCGDSGPRTVSALNCTVGAALDDASAVAALLLATGADGLNGDTMGQFDRQFYLRGTQVTERPIALEPEMGSSVEQIAWSTLAWAEGWNYTPLPSTWPQPWPTVSAAKYASGGTYMVHLTERWAQNKAPQAATAWL